MIRVLGGPGNGGSPCRSCQSRKACAFLPFYITQLYSADSFSPLSCLFLFWCTEAVYVHWFPRSASWLEIMRPLWPTCLSPAVSSHFTGCHTHVRSSMLWSGNMKETLQWVSSPSFEQLPSSGSNTVLKKLTKRALCSGLDWINNHIQNNYHFYLHLKICMTVNV